MITQYRTFEDKDNRPIPDCEIEAWLGVKASGAFENDKSLWVQLNKINLTVVELIGGQWLYYGVFTWSGAVAIKPGEIYDIKTNAAILSQGTYGLTNFEFETAPQKSGLYWQDGLFDLRFRR